MGRASHPPCLTLTYPIRGLYTCILKLRKWTFNFIISTLFHFTFKSEILRIGLNVLLSHTTGLGFVTGMVYKSSTIQTISAFII